MLQDVNLRAMNILMYYLQDYINCLHITSQADAK